MSKVNEFYQLNKEDPVCGNEKHFLFFMTENFAIGTKGHERGYLKIDGKEDHARDHGF